VKPEKRIDKFKGALLGTFVGDALGMPIEGLSPAEIRKQYGKLDFMEEARLGKGTYTDDTEMMIGLAESLIELKAFDPTHVANMLVKNLNVDRGYGWGSYQVLQLVSKGVPWEDATWQVIEGGSFGNGCAMRIAPLPLFFIDHPGLLKEAAFNSCRITHSHPLGMEGGYLQAFAVWSALRISPDESLDPYAFLDELQGEAEYDEFKDKFYRVRDLLDRGDVSEEEVVEQLGNDPTTVGSVPAAIYSFLANHKSFEDSVVKAVHLGGDTDTIGAMCGAIAGAYFGKSHIPSKWYQELENEGKGRDYVEQLALGLCKINTFTQ